MAHWLRIGIKGATTTRPGDLLSSDGLQRWRPLFGARRAVLSGDRRSYRRYEATCSHEGDHRRRARERAACSHAARFRDRPELQPINTDLRDSPSPVSVRTRGIYIFGLKTSTAVLTRRALSPRARARARPSAARASGGSRAGRTAPGSRAAMGAAVGAAATRGRHQLFAARTSPTTRRGGLSAQPVLAREIVQVLAIHLRLASSRADVARVALEQPAT